jgi:hypothetical protein
MDWLTWDEVGAAELPDWARQTRPPLDGRPYRVELSPTGIVLRRGGRASAVPYEDILVPIRLDDPRRLLLAVAREPPKPPWFELSGRDVGEIQRALDERLSSLSRKGYRGPRRRRPPMPPNEILNAVLAHEPVPGAVEIPIARPGVLTRSVSMGLLAGAIMAVVGATYAQEIGMWIGGAVGIGAGAWEARRGLQVKGASRVLVLTPDGFVGGLDGRSVRAVAWERVGRFLEGVDALGRPALEVRSSSDEVMARVAATWFGKPLDVIVAVAEAYRQRALRPF